MVNKTGDNNFSTATWIVNKTAGLGTHTTIASALSSASSGDTIFVMPGIWTENLTLKAGVNLVAYSGDSDTPNVSIVGKATFTAAGTVTISNVRLTTNSDFFLAVTGSAASIVNLNNCYLNCSNNTGISYTSSSASSGIAIYYCVGDIGALGIALFAHSAAGSLFISNLRLDNSGASTTANTISAGTLTIEDSIFVSPITGSGTSNIALRYTSVSTSSTNTITLTIGGSGTNTVQHCTLNAGTESAISISAILQVTDTFIASGNTNAITGGGTLNFSNLTFQTSSVMNTTTQSAIAYNQFGKFQATGQPSFLAYLGSTALNKTGAGAAYTLGTDALTEVFDQDSNFNTNGTFTAPVTGRYQLSASAYYTGCTIATTFQLALTTSNRSYFAYLAKAVGTQDEQNVISALCDMDAADTCTVVVTVSGEAGNTVDILSFAAITQFGGFLAN